MKYKTPHEVQVEIFERELVESGILCKECGALVENSRIGTSHMVRPNRKPCLCDKCRQSKPMETEYNSKLERM